MHDIKTNFDKILEVLKSILKDSVNSLGNFPKVIFRKSRKRIETLI